jgi:hypothetical protein
VTGRISKIGDKGVRSMLYEAARSILAKPVKGGTLKSWAARFAKRGWDEEGEGCACQEAGDPTPRAGKWHPLQCGKGGSGMSGAAAPILAPCRGRQHRFAPGTAGGPAASVDRHCARQALADNRQPIQKRGQIITPESPAHELKPGPPIVPKLHEPGTVAAAPFEFRDIARAAQAPSHDRP